MAGVRGLNVPEVTVVGSGNITRTNERRCGELSYRTAAAMSLRILALPTRVSATMGERLGSLAAQEFVLSPASAYPICSLLQLPALVQKFIERFGFIK